MPISFSDIVSSLALALSTYATIQTVRFNAKQNNLIESQEKLNIALLKKEEVETSDGKKLKLAQ